MAINLVHRPDLDNRVERLAERLADRLGLKGRPTQDRDDRASATLLEKHVAHDRPERRSRRSHGVSARTAAEAHRRCQP